MTWPPPIPPNDRANDTVEADNHPTDHNQISDALTEIVTRVDSRQPSDADLTAIAALTTTPYGRAFLELADQNATMNLLKQSTETQKGIVELATSAETVAGTDTARAVHPAGMQAAILGSRVNPPTVVAFMGDSIVANGGSKTPYGGCIFTGVSWPLWSSIHSGGKFIVGRIIGTGGYTSQDLLTNHLPVILSDVPKPGYCVVLIGTNDPAVLTIAQSKAALLSIYEQLQQAGIVPVLCTLTPRSAWTAGHTQINAYIRETAARRGWPLVDFQNSVLLDEIGDGTFATVYTGDGLHANNPAASKMGELVAQALTYVLLPLKPTLTPMNADTMNKVSTTNSVLVTDTNADGVPDGWTRTEQSGTGISTGLASVAGVIGKQARLTGGTGTCYLQSTAMNSGIAIGNLMLLSVVVETTWVAGDYDINLARFGGVQLLFTDITVPIPAGSVITLLVTAASTTMGNMSMESYGGANIIKISQPTCYNLTTMSVV